MTEYQSIEQQFGLNYETKIRISSCLLSLCFIELIQKVIESITNIHMHDNLPWYLKYLVFVMALIAVMQRYDTHLCK